MRPLRLLPPPPPLGRPPPPELGADRLLAATAAANGCRLHRNRAAVAATHRRRWDGCLPPPLELAARRPHCWVPDGCSCRLHLGAGGSGVTAAAIARSGTTVVAASPGSRGWAAVAATARRGTAVVAASSVTRGAFPHDRRIDSYLRLASVSILRKKLLAVYCGLAERGATLLPLLREFWPPSVLREDRVAGSEVAVSRA